MNNPNSGSLILTESCNLNCSYCYEKGQHTNCFMDLNIAKKAVDFFIDNAKKDGDDHIQINFFGGEPLINFATLKDTFYYAVKRCNEENLKFKGSIVTNGTLFPDGYEEFLKDLFTQADFVVQISIDGSKEAHDLSRKYLDGRGSFDDIVNNIKRYHAVIDKYNIDKNRLLAHMVVSKPTLQHMANGYKELVNIGYKGIWHLAVQEEDWDEQDVIEYRKQLEEIAEFIKNKVKETNDLSYLKINPVMSNCPAKVPEYPCSAGRKYITITPSGDIYPCHDFYFSTKGSDEMLIGSINTGIDDDKRFIFLNYDSDSMFTDKFCGNCSNTACYRCIARNYKNNGSILIGFPKYCKMVDVEHEVKYKLLTELENLGYKNLMPFKQNTKTINNIPELTINSYNFNYNSNNKENICSSGCNNGEHKCKHDFEILNDRITKLEQKLDIMFDLFTEFYKIFIMLNNLEDDKNDKN